ncbi:hypothetical protein ABIA32_002692 [Streptacidiphilus sp. MAP12-20]|uniref:hypothetical protein n=1 Tax=Streptacidiphilus sp. MAP12-20 TaxID=3156299 RepID=UPI003514CE2F
MSGFTTADAVAREATWLAGHGDGLPALLTANGGPWDIVQAYLPRTPAARKSQLYVLRRRLQTERMSQQRRLATYTFHLTFYWPIGATTVGTNLAESEQQALDNALDLVRQRVEGFVGDKTHGGKFLSVAESPSGTRFDVEMSDPGQSMSGGAFLEGFATYVADDAEYVM